MSNQTHVQRGGKGFIAKRIKIDPLRGIKKGPVSRSTSMGGSEEALDLSCLEIHINVVPERLTCECQKLYYTAIIRTVVVRAWACGGWAGTHKHGRVGRPGMV